MQGVHTRELEFWGHFEGLPTIPLYDIDMLGSIFKLITYLTFKNKAETVP